MKVGDRVKVIKDHVFPENIGLVGEITHIIEPDYIWIALKNGRPLPFHHNELEVVKEYKEIRLNLLSDIQENS